MTPPKISAAPDYTNPALVMFAVNLIWIFFVIWVLYGFVPVLILAVLINHGIGRLDAWRTTGRS